MTDWMQAATPALLTAIGVSVAAWINRLGKRGDRENSLIDQLQEDLQRATSRIDSLDHRVSTLSAEVHRLTTRDGLWQVHAERLEGQVTSLGGVPVPRPIQLREVTHGD